MFLQVSVCPQEGGEGVCLSACWDARTPRDWADTPPGLGRQHPPGPGRLPRTRQTPPRGSRLQHTVYEQPVRILLECILVIFFHHFIHDAFFSYSATPLYGQLICKKSLATSGKGVKLIKIK